jgi:hypothetical protein
LQDMSIQRNKVRGFLKSAHNELMNLDITDFGFFEDDLYDVLDKPSNNYVDALRLTKTRKC